MIRYIRWAILGLSCLALVAAGLYIWALRDGHLQVSEAYESLAWDGRPIDPVACIPPTIADSDNAAINYAHAAKELRKESLGETNALKDADRLAKSILTSGDSPADRAEWKKFVDSDAYKRAAAELNDAATKQGYRQNLDYIGGPDTALPHLSYLRALTRIRCANAVILAHNADSGAWEELQLAAKMAEQVSREPFLISYLVHIEQCNIIGQAIGRLIELSAVHDPPAITEIDATLGRCDDVEVAVQAVDADRLLLGEWTFSSSPTKLHEVIFHGEEDHSPTTKGLVFLYATLGRPYYLRDKASYLSLAGVATTNLCEEFSTDDLALSKHLYADVPVTYLLSRSLAPALFQVKFKYLKAAASIRMSRMALRLASWRQKHNSYPKASEEVDRIAFLDPYTGEAIRYTSTDDYFQLYCCGENMRDDGGTQDDSLWKGNSSKP